MTLTRRRLRMLEIATWWPMLYMLLFLAFWLVWMGGIVGLGVLGPQLSPGAGASAMAGGLGLFAVVMVLHLFTMVELFGLLAVHAALAIQTAREPNQGLLWAILCFVGGPIGQLLHLYLSLKPRLAELEAAA